MSKEKGLAVSVDFTLALFLFFIVLSVFLGLWQVNVFNANNERLIEEMRQVAFQTTDLLVLSKGIPGNWYKSSISDVNVVGLSKSPKYRVLNKKKVLAFVASDYNTVKSVLGIEGFDYYFAIKSDPATTLVSSGTDNESARYIVASRRLVNYEGNNRVLLFKVWYDFV